MAHWLRDEHIDSWVPGSLRSYDECRRAVHTARKHMKKNGDHNGFNKWLKQFETETNVYMTPMAQNQVGIGGGCICLAKPDMAYMWYTQMAPLLKQQMHNYRRNDKPFPTGMFGNHKALAVCELGSAGANGDQLNRCRSLTTRLYEQEHSIKPDFIYNFPDDPPIINRNLHESMCYPEYILPKFN